MSIKNKERLPHLLIKNTAISSRYSPPKKGRNSEITLPQRTRQTHAQHLIQQFETIQPRVAELIQAQKDFGCPENGIYLSFEVIASFELKFESLEYQRSGIELCNVKQENDKSIATVFIPEGKLTYFLNKVIQYRDKNTSKGKPQHETLISSISEIKLAALKQLWTDSIDLFPTTEQSIWWELWLRHSSKIDAESFIRIHADKLNIKISQSVIKFLDRTVILVYATKTQLSHSIHILGLIAEVRTVKDTADFYTSMNQKEQKQWIDDALSRINPPPKNSPYICILDTGINEAHPLLKPIANTVDMHSYHPAWGSDDRKGHGTNMAGLAIYGDITAMLSHNFSINLTHRLESVKILPNSGNNDKLLYGAIINDCIARVEIEQPYRARTFYMAVTTLDGINRGRPSSWSAVIDGITSGYFDESQRLMIISAGNTEEPKRHQYPDSNLTDEIHDPAQSWNALTVGAYTEKVWLDKQYSDNNWTIIAPFGDLSASSCTSMSWDKTWPIKPEIVMEGGNQAISPYDGKADYIDEGLQLLTTGHNFQFGRLLVSFGDTSGATALASRLAATVQANYPQYWAETVRALLVHSAEWTDAMKTRFSPLKRQKDYQNLLRYCGYGVPNENKLFWSASNALTLIAQDSLQPFIKRNSNSGAVSNELNIHTLPWPTEILRNLPVNTQVEMKITLSYFIEPNPGERGYKNRYCYASHGLRFDVKRPLETLEDFKLRINQKARDEENQGNAYSPTSESGKWLLGEKLRHLGSVHSDIWTGSAQELAERSYIAVYPVLGWWKQRINLKRWHKKARYSLIVTIKTPNIETDIYTIVANKITTTIEV